MSAINTQVQFSNYPSFLQSPNSSQFLLYTGLQNVHNTSFVSEKNGNVLDVAQFDVVYNSNTYYIAYAWDGEVE